MYIFHYLELKVAINSLGIEAKAQAVYQMIAELDKDGSGLIEFDEFFLVKKVGERIVQNHH